MANSKKPKIIKPTREGKKIVPDAEVVTIMLGTTDDDRADAVNVLWSVSMLDNKTVIWNGKFLPKKYEQTLRAVLELVTNLKVK